MRLPFLRKPEHDEPMVVAMTGIRLGDKVHFWGSRSDLLLPLAARVGLSGQFTIISRDGPRLKALAEREGVLVDADGTLRPDAGFDLAIVQAEGDWAAALGPLLAATRPGGRVIVISGAPAGGLLGRFRGGSRDGPPEARVIQALAEAGWSRARGIGEREGLRFVEGMCA